MHLSHLVVSAAEEYDNTLAKEEWKQTEAMKQYAFSMSGGSCLADVLYSNHKRGTRILLCYVFSICNKHPQTWFHISVSNIGYETVILSKHREFLLSVILSKSEKSGQHNRCSQLACTHSQDNWILRIKISHSVSCRDGLPRESGARTIFNQWRHGFLAIPIDRIFSAWDDNTYNISQSHRVLLWPRQSNRT